MKPDIIVSTVDFERLESLIGAAPPASSAMAELLEELKRADVVEPHEIPPSVVTMNSTVRFTVGPRKEELCRTLVYPRDVTDSSTISVLSPVGSALLGLSVGSRIEWPSPTGEPLLIEIIDVIHRPNGMQAERH